MDEQTHDAKSPVVQQPAGNDGSPSPQARTAGGRSTHRFRAMSFPKKIITALLGVATAIGAVWGAVQAVQGIGSLIAQAHERAHPSDFVRTQWLGLEVWQDGRRLGLFEDDPSSYNHSRADLDPAPFELRFPREYADLGLRLVAWTDPSVHVERDRAPAVDPDGTEVNMFFHFGTTYAVTGAGNGNLVLSDHGNNILVDSIVNPVSSEQGAAYYSRYLYGGDVDGGPPGLVRDLKGKDLYLTAWVDQDQDGVVNWGEYDYVRLHF